jgi:hypothetical protein
MKILNSVILLGLSGALVYGALSPDPGAGADAAGGLTRAVASIAEKSRKPAQDYSLLAEETLRFGQRPDAVDKLNKATPNGCQGGRLAEVEGRVEETTTSAPTALTR